MTEGSDHPQYDRAKCPDCGMKTIIDHEDLAPEEMLCSRCYEKEELGEAHICETIKGMFADDSQALAAYRAIGTPEQIKRVIEEVEKTVEVLGKRIKLKVDAGGDVIIEHCLSESLKKLNPNKHLESKHKAKS